MLSVLHDGAAELVGEQVTLAPRQLVNDCLMPRSTHVHAQAPDTDALANCKKGRSGVRWATGDCLMVRNRHFRHVRCTHVELAEFHQALDLLNLDKVTREAVPVKEERRSGAVPAREPAREDLLGYQEIVVEKRGYTTCSHISCWLHASFRRRRAADAETHLEG